MESLPVAHFESVCKFVHQTYGDLFSPRERQWLGSVEALDTHAKCLYVRLLNRRFNTFRVSKLKYAEIPDIGYAVRSLELAGLANAMAPQNPLEINRLFTKTELIKLFDRAELKNKTKAEIIDAIYHQKSIQPLPVLQAADKWVTVEGHDVYSWFLLCFFGNRYQDMTEFVLRDIGATRYFPYLIDEATRAFANREQIDAHLACYESAALYEHVDKRDAAALLNLNQSLPSVSPGDPTLTRRVERLQLQLARHLERCGQLEQALGIYKLCSRAPARERMVRIYHGQAELALAEQLLTEIEQQPYSDEELQFVETFRPKLARDLGIKQVHAIRFKPSISKLVLAPCNDVRVEEIARRYYQRSGDCAWVENALLNGVLGLLIWDEIFAALPGVFFNPFQSAPADFYDPGFYQRREQPIAARLKFVNTPEFKPTILSLFSRHYGTANPLVRWESLNESLLSLALDRIPAQHWQACFERQLQDLRYNTSGLPDLIYFSATGDYEMIEIKGPGDTVQKNQMRWFKYFSDRRMPYRVVHIKWANTVVPS